MSKRMVSWRLEETLIASLKEEAESLGIEVTELVEEKLETPHALVEILRELRRLARKIDD